MERIFFSKQNFNIIYGIVRKKISNNINYDISSSNSFHNELKNVMKSVYVTRNKFNIPTNISNVDASRYLSQKVIKIAIPYFIETINKTQSINKVHSSLERGIDSVRMNQPSNNLSLRPNATFKKDQQNISQQYDSLVKSRDLMKQMPEPINFKDNKSNPTSKDIQNRYNQIAKDRETDYETTETNTFIHPSIKVNPSNNNISDSTVNQFNATPQMNSSVYSEPTYNDSDNMGMTFLDKKEDTKKDTTNFLESQFGNNITGAGSNDKDTSLEMDGDNIEDYDDIIKLMNMPNPINENGIIGDLNVDKNIEEQFTNKINPKNETNEQKIINLENIFPSNITNNSNERSMEKTLTKEHINKNVNKEIINKEVNMLDRGTFGDNTELVIITNAISKQQENLQKTNDTLNRLIATMEKQDISKFYETMISIPDLMKRQMNERYKYKRYSLVVSSRDRDLNNWDFNKYDFRVVFGSSGGTTYDQKIVNYNGTSGCIEDGVGDCSPGVASSKVSPNQLSYESRAFVNAAAQNPTVDNVLRNIVSIKLQRVVLPRPRDEVYYPDPYYFVCIDEFDSNVITSKHFNEKIFSKVVYDREVLFGGIGNSAVTTLGESDTTVSQETTGGLDGNIRYRKSDDGRKYIYLLNEDGDEKVFYPAPLAKLENMTIKLVDSRGKCLSESWCDTDKGLASFTTGEILFFNYKNIHFLRAHILRIVLLKNL